MVLYKSVNGKRVKLTAREVTEYNKQQVAAALITKTQVNVECKRRIFKLLLVKDDQSSNEKQSNLLAEYMVFQDILIDGGTLTTEQTTRRAYIKAGNELLKDIITASNVLTAMDVIPDDYTDDKHWPEGS